VRKGVAADVELALPAVGAHLETAGDVVEHKAVRVALVTSVRRMRTRPDASPRSSTAIATIGLPVTPRPAAPDRRAPK
jgi:hypothetical protein